CRAGDRSPLRASALRDEFAFRRWHKTEPAIPISPASTPPPTTPNRKRMRRLRASLLWILPLALACRRSEPTPNVVLVVVDALRADRLGSYGGPRPTSPHLDA